MYYTLFFLYITVHWYLYVADESIDLLREMSSDHLYLNDELFMRNVCALGFGDLPVF